MKHHTPVLVVAAVALTGCVNWNSFNASNPAPGATPAAQAKPSPTPGAKTQAAKKQPANASPSPTPKATSPAPSSSTSSAPAPAPKPTPRVISEESSTTIKVLESRPVVGTDAEMGN
ncbi:MAG: hypothetical protein ACKOJB_03845 [Chthoniobacterales bacterium]